MSDKWVIVMSMLHGKQDYLDLEANVKYISLVISQLSKISHFFKW